MMRKTLKWILIVVCVLVVLFLMQLTALAYPQPMFDYRLQHGSIVFYSDAPVDENLSAALQEVELRLAGTELYDPAILQHVFVCQQQRTFDIFRRLSLIPDYVPGFNLSIFDNSFVSVPLLDLRRENNGTGVVYSTLSGNIGHSIAHEVMHDLMVAHGGYFANRSLPPWKTEGYAEYGASIAMIRADSAATLSSRIELLNRFHDKRPYDYYRWHLTVEYLCEYEGFTYDEVMADEVTLDDAYRRMMLWHGQQPVSPI